MKIYLSSPYEQDRANQDWKLRVDERLRGIDPRFETLDPCPPTCVEQDHVDQLRREQRWYELAEFSSVFVETDFAMMRDCVGMIAYLPYRAVTFGTTHEIVRALETKLPLVLVMPEGKDKVSAWLWGILGPHRIFDNVNDAVDALAQRVLVVQGELLNG